MLLEIVAGFQEHSGYPIVEPAHMELAEPSIETAFDRCVRRGARLVVVFPYFLLPGKHCREDVPALTAAAAAKHPDTVYCVTKPFGQHPLMAEIMQQRIEGCLADAPADDD
jgi:sirohydrochlorin ferrochelatase